MTKKFFLLCMAILLAVHGAAFAKDKGLPESERINIAVEVTDDSRHKDLNSASLLEELLYNRLVNKNLINVVGVKPFVESSAAQSFTGDLGELLIFDAVELPPPEETAANFDPTVYQNLGASYVIRCEVLALGLRKVEDPTVATITSLVGGGISFGASKTSSRDKNLRRIAAGISLIGGAIDMRRTALNTVVKMQFIDAATGKVLWQENIIGEGLKHHSPGKEFDNVWTRALHESVDDSAKTISKRVNKYVDKVIIKGKSDKDFLPKQFSLGDLGGLGGLKRGKLF